MEQPQIIRIALAEDHQLLRNTLVSVLNDEPDFVVVQAATNGAELLDGLESCPADVILIDLNMPIMDGRDTLPVLLEKFQDSRVIVLSMYYGDAYTEKYMRIGAHGYLSKDCAPAYLKQAIRDVYEDGIFLHEKTPAQSLLSLIEDEIYLPKDPQYPLSDTEKEIMLLMCDQKSLDEIADTMDMDAEEVQANRQAIMTKLGVRNNAGVLAYALKNDLYRLML